MARKRKGPAPVFVVLAGPDYETSKPFAVVMGKDAEGWANRLKAELEACTNSAAVKQLADKWENPEFTHLGQVEDVRVYPVIPCRCYMTTAEADREVDTHV